jgi:PhnB protein
VAKLSVHGAEFWFSGESSEDGTLRPESSGGGSIRMLLTLSDPDAVSAQAVKAAAAELFPVGEEHGWGLGRVVDPFGTTGKLAVRLSRSGRASEVFTVNALPRCSASVI